MSTFAGSAVTMLFIDSRIAVLMKLPHNDSAGHVGLVHYIKTDDFSLTSTDKAHCTYYVGIDSKEHPSLKHVEVPY